VWLSDPVATESAAFHNFVEIPHAVQDHRLVFGMDALERGLVVVRGFAADATSWSLIFHSQLG